MGPTSRKQLRVRRSFLLRVTDVEKQPSGEEAIAGIGLGDQRLFILPDEQRLVVTIFAGQDGGMYRSDRILARILAARQSSYAELQAAALGVG